MKEFVVPPNEENQNKFTRPAANKTRNVFDPVLKKRVPVAMRYFNYTRGEIYSRYAISSPPRNISRNTFYKILRKHLPHIGTSRRKTDVCDRCVEMEKAERELAKIIAAQHGQCSAENIASCLAGKCGVADSGANCRETIHNVTLHKQHADVQKNAYKDELEKLTPGNGVIVIDFKSNIYNQYALEENSTQFYSKPSRAYFGAVVYYRLRESPELLRYRIFDLVSDILTKDSLWAIRGLEKIFSSATFTDLGIDQSLSFWMDNGPSHFRTKEWNHFLFELPTKKQFRVVRWNYFTEYHGKSVCDTHFSRVSAAVKAWTSNDERKIENTQQLIHALTEQFKSWCNQVKASEPKKRYKTSENKPKEKVYKYSCYDLHVDELKFDRTPVKTILDLTNATMTHYFSYQSNGHMLEAGLDSSRRARVGFKIEEKTRDGKAKEGLPTPHKNNYIHKDTARACAVATARQKIYEVCLILFNVIFQFYSFLQQETNQQPQPRDDDEEEEPVAISPTPSSGNDDEVVFVSPPSTPSFGTKRKEQFGDNNVCKLFYYPFYFIIHYY